ALLTDGTPKGKLDFFALNDSAAGETVSLDNLTPTVSMVLDGTNSRASMDFPATNASRLAVRWTPVVPDEKLNLREVESFGSASPDNYEVGMKADAVAAYDPSGTSYTSDGKEMKDPKDSKDLPEVAAGPQGGPYLPGALGFPPNVNGRRV